MNAFLIFSISMLATFTAASNTHVTMVGTVQYSNDTNLFNASSEFASPLDTLDIPTPCTTTEEDGSSRLHVVDIPTPCPSTVSDELDTPASDTTTEDEQMQTELAEILILEALAEESDV